MSNPHPDDPTTHLPTHPYTYQLIHPPTLEQHPLGPAILPARIWMIVALLRCVQGKSGCHEHTAFSFSLSFLFQHSNLKLAQPKHHCHVLRTRWAVLALVAACRSKGSQEMSSGSSRSASPLTAHSVQCHPGGEASFGSVSWGPLKIFHHSMMTDIEHQQWLLRGLRFFTQTW